MKNSIRTEIREKIDAGIFSFCILAGFICIVALAYFRNESAVSFGLAGLVCFPIGIAAERGFKGFLLNGILGQFIGVSFVLLPNLGTEGGKDLVYIYLGTAAVSISLVIAALLLYRLLTAISVRIKHLNAN